MKRRSFLRHIQHAAATSVVGTLSTSLGYGKKPSSKGLSQLLQEACEKDRVLVLIYLQGGNDGLNTIIPLEYISELSAVRPHVYLKENEILQLGSSNIGLHPALSGLKELYDYGELKIIQNVSYPEQNYSHFRSTDIWMSGSDSNEIIGSGWMGRHLDQTFPGFPEAYPNNDMTDPLAIEIGNSQSMVFQGPTAAMGMVIKDEESFFELVNNTEQPAPETAAGEKLKFVRLIARQSQQYGKVVVEAAEKVTSQAPYPEDNKLAEHLRIVSRLIAGGLKTPLYLVKMGGFDTHDNQVEVDDHTQGEHADLLKQLNDAIMAFRGDLEYQGTENKVAGMTFSEFGRRIVSNASNGTDHGSAAPLFVFGKGIESGTLGKAPIINGQETYQDNLAMEYDFRDIYNSVIEEWFCNSEAEAETSMLGKYRRLGIFKGSGVPLGFDDSYEAELFKANSAKMLVFPTAFQSTTNIVVKSDGTPFTVNCINMSGQRIERIYSGQSSSGDFTIPWTPAQLASGYYIIELLQSGKRHTKQVVKS